MPDGSFAEYKLSEHRGKYVVLFFWPLDFTFVCPSEIIAHNNRVKQLQELKAEIVGISIDSHYTHLA
ncbi:MAG: redoxin domain-containing protein [Desulfuromonas sp.]|nr:redoxin domain-containing protein [Desulfuromonas sp.]